MLRRVSKKFLHFDKKLFDTGLNPVYKERTKGGERFPAGLMEERTMAYGMFYKQVEITKKNGRLPSVEDAIRLAEQRFWDDDAPNPCQCFNTLEEAREALAKLKCELCPSQYYALGSGYCAYMYNIAEIGSGDGYGFAEWSYPQDEEED